MSEHNITVEGGSSVRLPTAGKYCDRDIVITAEGGSGGGQIYVDAVVEVKVGETITLASLGSDEGQSGTPTLTLHGLGENPDIIRAELQEEYAEWLEITGVSVGKTIITYEYNTEQWEDSYLRTVNIQINVVPGGGSTESDAEYQYEDTVSVRPGDPISVALPCPYDSPGGSGYTIISGGHLIEYIEDMADLVEIMAANDTGTAVIRFDYGSYEPERGEEVSCTLILTINVE